MEPMGSGVLGSWLRAAGFLARGSRLFGGFMGTSYVEVHL